MLTLVAMADTHLYHDDLEVPPADILIHAGDMTRAGSLEELAEANAFLAALPHRHKIIVAGNHDRCFEHSPDAARDILNAGHYLQDEAIVIEGLKFYGSPWQPAFNDWAFNLPRGDALAQKWALIPDDTDVLITHGPPEGIGDRVDNVERAGCADLLRRVREVGPKLHIFGHIHPDRGIWKHEITTFVNATTDECMAPVTLLRYPG